MNTDQVKHAIMALSSPQLPSVFEFPDDDSDPLESIDDRLECAMRLAVSAAVGRLSAVVATMCIMITRTRRGAICTGIDSSCGH